MKTVDDAIGLVKFVGPHAKNREWIVGPKPPLCVVLKKNMFLVHLKLHCPFLISIAPLPIMAS